MLSAPAAPAPIEIANKRGESDDGMNAVPARSAFPANAVSTTNDITRGFRSEKNSIGPAA